MAFLFYKFAIRAAISSGLITLFGSDKSGIGGISTTGSSTTGASAISSSTIGVSITVASKLLIFTRIEKETQVNLRLA